MRSQTQTLWPDGWSVTIRNTCLLYSNCQDLLVGDKEEDRKAGIPNVRCISAAGVAVTHTEELSQVLLGMWQGRGV